MTRLITSCLLAATLSHSACSQPAASTSSLRRIEPTYLDQRAQLLQRNPADRNLSPRNTGEVWAVLIDTAYPDATVTLTATADGSVSLHYSHGGAMLNLGQSPEPRQAATSLLAAAATLRSLCQPAADHPLPPPGSTRFTLLTWTGPLAAQAPTAALAAGRHRLSPLYAKSIALHAAIRIADDRLNVDGDAR